jgi:hypothetical protein
MHFKPIYTFSITRVTFKIFFSAKQAVAVNQHHDAISGTAKQAVTDDYALRLDR